MDNNLIKTRVNNILKEAFEQDIPSLYKKLVALSKTWGGKIYLVGGAVRDELLGMESKDLDFLATKITLPELAKKLQHIMPGAKVDEVGQSFGIIKLTIGHDEFDFAIPRSDIDRQNVTSDPNIPVERDLERRDFTINAIAKDLETGELVQPPGQNGLADIKNKIIRAVGDPKQRFDEDPLRMLRAIQFASRFGFTIEPKTLNAIKENRDDFLKLSKERFKSEFIKGWTKGNADTRTFFQLLNETGVGLTLFGKEFDPIIIQTKGMDEKDAFVFQYIGAFLNGGDYTVMSPIVDDHNWIKVSRWFKDAIQNGIKPDKLKEITKFGHLFSTIREVFRMIDEKNLGSKMDSLISKPIITRQTEDKWAPWELPVLGGELIAKADELGKPLKGKAITEALMKLILAYQNGDVTISHDKEQNKKDAIEYFVSHILDSKEIKEAARKDIFNARLARILV